MAKAMSSKEAVPLDEVVLGQAFELEALLNTLEGLGLVTLGDPFEQTKRIKS
jgi:hypothetical protein